MVDYASLTHPTTWRDGFHAVRGPDGNQILHTSSKRVRRDMACRVPADQAISPINSAT